MAGVQGFLPAGLLALALWAVGWSLIGLRWRTIPLPVCVLGLIPAVHVLGRVLGEIGGLPESLWIVLVAAVPGTMIWCLALGIGLVARRLRRGTSAPES